MAEVVHPSVCYLNPAQYLSKLPLGPGVALAIMASGAGGQTAYEAKQNGANTDQALKLGTIAGIAEAATEKIPLENISAVFTGGKLKTMSAAFSKLLKNEIAGSIVGSTLEEGMEEFVTEYINNVANQIVLGDQSDMKRYAAELMASGMSKEDAEKTAFI